MTVLSVFFIPGLKDKYHFGSKDWEETRINCPSHTFYSAIINNYVVIYGENDLNEIKDKIIVSDLFPAIFNAENEPIVKFIPKPIAKLEILNELVKKETKLWKRVSFISEGFYKKFLNNPEIEKIKKEDIVILKNKFVITNEEFEKLCKYMLNDEKRDLNKRKEELKKISLFSINSEIKTSVDRIKGSSLESHLYKVNYVKPNFYTDDKNNKVCLRVGYWAKVKILEEKFKEKIRKAIKMIKYNGLGGERSTGSGFFKDIIIDKENFEELSNAPYYVVLSSYVPKKEEWENKRNWDYILENYFGWCFSYLNPSINNKPKKSIKYIIPGSVVSEKVEGTIINLSLNESYNIWFNGKPILLPLNRK